MALHQRIETLILLRKERALTDQQREAQRSMFERDLFRDFVALRDQVARLVEEEIVLLRPPVKGK